LTTHNRVELPGWPVIPSAIPPGLRRATGYEQPDDIADLSCKDRTRRDVLDGWEANRNGKAILLVG
jgi:hypothetical protein